MTDKKTKRSISLGKILLVAAALVQGIQYVYAFVMVHSSSLPGLAVAGGLLAGGVVVGSVAYAGGQLSLIRSKRARAAAWTVFVILLTVSPFILTPINWYSMASDLRASIGGYSWILAALVASVPELAIALLAFSDRNLLPAAQPASSAAQPAKSVGRSAGRSASFAAQPVKVYACNFLGCGYSTDRQTALAAHMSHHSRKAKADNLASELFKDVKGGQL